MSGNLYAEPTERKKIRLSFELRLCIQKIEQREFTESDYSYLLGLYHAGIEDAKTLMEMIGKYGNVTLSIEY